MAANKTPLIRRLLNRWTPKISSKSLVFSFRRKRGRQIHKFQPAKYRAYFKGLLHGKLSSPMRAMPRLNTDLTPNLANIIFCSLINMGLTSWKRSQSNMVNFSCLERSALQSPRNIKKFKRTQTSISPIAWRGTTWSHVIVRKWLTGWYKFSAS